MTNLTDETIIKFEDNSHFKNFVKGRDIWIFFKKFNKMQPKVCIVQLTLERGNI